jgi:hypothetical protein
MKREKAEHALLCLALAATLAACGSSSYTTGGASTGTAPPAATSTTPFTGTTGTTNTTNQLPAIDESFTLAGTRGGVSGTSSASYTVSTDNLLQVTVTAGTAGSITVPGYGFSAAYQCVTYKVTVLGDTITTNPLSTSTSGEYTPDCPGAANTQMIDFSSRLTPGHGSVSVTVESNTDDFDCISCVESYGYGYGGTCENYCPMDLTFNTHTVTGTLAIAVNGS